MVGKIATGEVEVSGDGAASKAATSGREGGKARARNMTAEQRASIAKKGCGGGVEA